MDSLEDLQAIEEIRRLKARYFRSLDAKDWVGFGEVFAEDARLDVTEEAGGAEPVVGRADIVELVRRVVGEAVSIHHGHTPEITIESSDAATGTWAMEDRLFWPEGSPLRSMHGYGHYHERYRRTAEGWKIERMLLTRLRLERERAPRA